MVKNKGLTKYFNRLANSFVPLLGGIVCDRFTNEIIIKTTQTKSFSITRPLLVLKWRKAKGSRRKE